jgi:hypothetical protein
MTAETSINISGRAIGVALDDTTHRFQSCDARVVVRRSIFSGKTFRGRKLVLLQTRRLGRLKAFVSSPGTTGRRFSLGDVVGRLIQVALALYLVPVLLVVLLVSAVGMALVAIARLFTSPIHTPVG